eukprot:353115-Chlamydomonas_euryale.AAC.3
MHAAPVPSACTGCSASSQRRAEGKDGPGGPGSMGGRKSVSREYGQVNVAARHATRGAPRGKTGQVGQGAWEVKGGRVSGECGQIHVAARHAARGAPWRGRARWAVNGGPRGGGRVASVLARWAALQKSEVGQGRSRRGCERGVWAGQGDPHCSGKGCWRRMCGEFGKV